MNRFYSLTPLATALFGMLHSHAFAAAPQQLDTLVFSAQSAERTQLDPFHQDLWATPMSIARIDQAEIAAKGIENLSDLAKQDTSLGDGYVPIGYYGNVISRGFALDSGNSYLINGQTVRGEQNIAFENKQQVDLLKGVAALNSAMATPGGVVNYVTKRPEDIKSLSLRANEYGQVGAHLDLGYLGKDEKWGYRLNLATEKLKPYIQEADGERYFASLALDYQIDSAQKIEFDTEWQQQQQYSVAGYQLFNGQLPTNISWDRALGHQAWSKPVQNDSVSTQVQYFNELNHNWDLKANASFSQAVIDDYSSFPWGCYSDVCQIDGLGNQFDTQGLYDLYDFQSPNDTRQTWQLGSALTGEISTGQLQHQLNLAWQMTNKRHQQHGAVNAWVGVGDATAPNIPVPPSDATLGARYTALKSQQHALHLIDQVRWHPAWAAVLGGKWLNLDEQANDVNNQLQRDTKISEFLPQLALMYQPTENTHVYMSYKEGLSDGAVAPWYAQNAFLSLVPRHSKQYEAGVKHQAQTWDWSMAVFDLTQDYQYAKAVGDVFWFVNEGEQRSRGLEVGLNAAIGSNVELASQATWLDAKVEGVAGFSEMQNVPKLRLNLQGRYHVSQVPGLSVAAQLRYSASKFANKTATVKAPAYTVVDLSAQHDFVWQGHAVETRLALDNVFNEYYWRDVGDYMGDDYLFLGAPRTLKLATTVKF